MANTDPESDSQKTPILGGLFVDYSWLDKSTRIYLKGHYIFERTEDQPLKELFFKSARFLGYELPHNLTFEAGEIFYDKHRIVEFRMIGRYVTSVNYDGSIEYALWHTGDKPHFKVSNRKLVISQADQERPYVAALKIGSSVLLAFDVEAGPNHELSPEVEASFIKINPWNIKGATEDHAAMLEAFLSNTEEQLRAVPVEKLKDYLLPSPPIEAGEPITIVVLEGSRKLIYYYDEEQLRYELALRYIRSVDVTIETLKTFAQENHLSLDRAKARSLYLHLRTREIFVKENLESYKAKCVDILKYTLQHLLKQEALDRTLIEFESPGLTIEPTPLVAKNTLLKSTTKAAKGRLGIKTKPGPEVGSKFKKDAKNIRQKNAEHKALILNAMCRIYKEALESGHEGRAEDIKRKDVAKALGRSRTTLYAWLNDGKVKFENLLDQAIRASRKNPTL